MTKAWTGASIALTALLVAVPAAGAQDADSAQPDSAQMHEVAKEAQRRFERFREDRIPPQLAQYARSCDDLVGRFCLIFERGEDEFEWRVPEEPVEFGMARVRVLRELNEIGSEIPGDDWVIGQRVYYMGEVGQWAPAEKLVTDCGGARPWWCTALLGYIQHARGDWIEAAATFEGALALMPEEERKKFLSLDYLLRPRDTDVYEDARDPEQLRRMYWLLSDPLYLVDGNDRQTEQLARQVLIRMRADAENAYGVAWGEDIEELTLRYGAEQAWERHRSVPQAGTLQDSRRIVGRHHPKSQQYTPPGDALEAPTDVAPGTWQMEKARPWTGYAPPYAPDMDHLETQIARFRRGDSLLVVGAFAPEDPLKRSRAVPGRLARNPRIIDLREARDESREDRQRRAANPFAIVQEEPEPFIEEEPEEVPPTESGLFLIDAGSGERHEVRGEGPEGAFMLQVPNGRYIAGIEAWSESTKEGWRDRHGIWQEDLIFGLAAMSDILVLEGGRELPESLDAAVQTAMPIVRIRSGESFQVAWEVYGLRIGESAQVRLGVDRVEEGVLRRFGQFLRMLEPDNPIELSFEDAGPDQLGTVFRAVNLNLPDLEPGAYTITVEIELSGREPMTVSRPLEIVP
jgi:hypothetical protein